MSLSQAPAEAPKKPRRTSASFISYHARLCSICRHPERAEIDQEFLHWTHVATIAGTYEIDRRAIYRHAHATKLFSQRNRGLRFALGHIIERAQSVEVTADSIVRAVRLFACLNDEGEWVAPPPRSAPFQTVSRSSPDRWGLSDDDYDLPTPSNSADAHVECGSSLPPCPAGACSGASHRERGAIQRSTTKLRGGRSTHPANLNVSQPIENAAQSHLQIDTNSHP